MKVLVADDSTAVRERLAALLSESESVELIDQARDASEMLDSVQTLKPDVVILDDGLARCDGFQVIHEIKSGTAAPAVIVLSTSAYPQYRKRCQQQGADLFLDKLTEIHRIADLIGALGED